MSKTTAAPVDEALAAIDTEAIKELRSLRDKQTILEQRLEQLESHKEKVSEVVFTRVQGDYKSQLDQLEERSRPLKQEAREEFAKLRDLLEELSSNRKGVDFERQELTLRHEVGEFSEEEYKSRCADIDKQLEEIDKRVEGAEKLKKSFVGAFRSEEELLSEVPEPPKKKKEDPSEVEAQPAAPNVEVPAEGHTVVLPSPGAGSTMVLPSHFLLRRSPEGEEDSHRLMPEVTGIGRDAANAIQINSKLVSRKHAQIVVAPDGYRVRDLDSENGTFVNGDRITEKLLVHGDTIKIGDTEFDFLESQPDGA